MNFLIIISFIVVIGMCVVLLMPRKIALYISGVNRFDLESVPYKYVLWVAIGASLLLILSTGLLIYEIKDITTPLPDYLIEFFELISG